MLAPRRSLLFRRALGAAPALRWGHRPMCAAKGASEGRPGSGAAFAAAPGASPASQPGWLSRHPQYPLGAFLFGIGFFIWRTSRSNKNQQGVEDALTDQQAIAHAEVDEVREVSPVNTATLAQIRDKVGDSCTYDELMATLEAELGKAPEEALSPQWAPVERALLALAERSAESAAHAEERARLVRELEVLWGKDAAARALGADGAGADGVAPTLPAAPAATRKALVRVYKRHVRALRGAPARQDEVKTLRAALRGRGDEAQPAWRALASQAGLLDPVTPATELRRLGRALRRCDPLQRMVVSDGAAGAAAGKGSEAASQESTGVGGAARHVRLDARAWLTALALVACDDAPDRLRFVHGLYAGEGGELDGEAAEDALGVMMVTNHFPAEFLVVQTGDWPARLYAAARPSDLAEKLRESAASVDKEAREEAERAEAGDEPKTERAEVLRRLERASREGCFTADEFMLAAGSKPLCALGACFTKAKAPEEEGSARKEEGEGEATSAEQAPASAGEERKG